MYRVTKFYKIGFCFAFFSEFLAIYPIYNLIFKDNGMSPMYIATLLIVQKTSKMLFDVPSGLIADLYGRRSVLIFGSILKIGMLLLFLINSSFTSFVVAMAMWGMAISCFFGNESAYAYDFLKLRQEEGKFSRFMGFYYVAQNIATAIACFVGGILYDIDGYKMAIILSLFMMLVTLFFGLQLPKYTNQQIDEHLSDKKIIKKNNFYSYLHCIKDLKILFFVLLLALSTALFLFFFDLNTVIMNDNGYDVATVSSIVGVVAIFSIFGNLISGFIAPRTSILFILALIASLIAFIAVGAFVDAQLIVFFVSAYLIFFTLIDLTITTKMQQLIDSHLRATIMSVSNLFSSIFLIFIHFLNGYIAENNFYNIAVINIMSILFCVVLFMIIWYFYVFKNSKFNLD